MLPTLLSSGRALVVLVDFLYPVSYLRNVANRCDSTLFERSRDRKGEQACDANNCDDWSGYRPTAAINFVLLCEVLRKRCLVNSVVLPVVGDKDT
jgi:hypothetical protein